MTRSRSYTRRERDLLAAALLSYRDTLGRYLMGLEGDPSYSRMTLDLETVRTLFEEFSA